MKAQINLFALFTLPALLSFSLVISSCSDSATPNNNPSNGPTKHNQKLDPHGDPATDTGSDGDGDESNLTGTAANGTPSGAGASH